MWRALDEKATKKIVSETEQSTASHVRIYYDLVLYAPFPDLLPKQAKFSPNVNDNNDRVDGAHNLFDLACAQSKVLLRNCKSSIEENVTNAMNVLGSAFNAVLSAFRPSGKERGPGGSYGDL